MKYLSITQTAERWGISTRRIQILCGEGRVPGAIRIGTVWHIETLLSKYNGHFWRDFGYRKKENLSPYFAAKNGRSRFSLNSPFTLRRTFFRRIRGSPQRKFLRTRAFAIRCLSLYNGQFFAVC